MSKVLSQKKTIDVYYTHVGWIVLSKKEMLRYNYIEEVMIDFDSREYILRVQSIDEFFKRIKPQFDASGLH